MRNIERIRTMGSRLVWVVLIVGMMLSVSCAKNDDGKEETTSLEVTADKTVFEDFGGSLSITIQADKNCVITSSAAWLTTSMGSWTVTAKGSRTSIQVYAARNTESSARTGIITVSSGNATKSIIFEQTEKATVIVDEAYVYVSEKGGNVDVRIKANIDCEYRMLSGSDWLIPANTKAPVTERVYKFKANENAGTTARNAEVLFFHGDFMDTVTVKQSACPAMNIDVEKTEAAPYGEKIAVKVVTNMNFKLVAPEWITLDLGEGVDPDKLFEEGETLGDVIELEGFIVVESSTSHEERSADLKFESISRSGITKSMSITQGGVGNSFGFTTSAINVVAPVIEGTDVSGYIMWGDDSTPVDYSASATYSYPRKEQGKEHEVRAVVTGGTIVTLNTLEEVTSIDVRMF